MAAGGSDSTLAEFRLIQRFFQRDSHASGDVVIGIGDDAAVTRPPSGCELVTATDSLVQGTHFLADAPAESIGHRVLAVNLSDLAAMGAAPHWATLALSLPEVDETWLQGFAEGFFALADRCNVRLIGGDTVKGPCAATVTIQGSVASGAAIRRSGAQVGDLVFVSGVPGAAAAGRRLLATKTGHRLCKHFEFPEPRLQLGRSLVGTATAMIDISDGLYADVGHLLAASKVGARLCIDAIDLTELTAAGFDDAESVELALAGGEDYELAFTAPAAARGRVEQLAQAQDISLAVLGEVTAGETVSWLQDDVILPCPTTAFRHFEG